MSEQPLISVLVTVYNTEPYVRECLDSILAQTYTKWEAIVVNDGSTDDSAHVINEFAAKDSRVHAYHQKNGGAGNAKNNAIKHARGEWLVWLDSDDYIDPTALQEVAAMVDDTVDIITLGMRTQLATRWKSPNGRRKAFVGLRQPVITLIFSSRHFHASYGCAP